MGHGSSKSGVVGWGSNDYAQLGCISSSKARGPRIIESLARGTQSAVSVCAAGSFSMVLLDSGEIAVFGKADSGQLGLGVGEYASPTPRLIKGALHGKFVKQLACGEHHCVAVTDSGSVFTWGRGQHGRLGHGLSDDEPTPRLVEGLVGVQITSITCGEYHTIVTSGSEIYTFGLGLSGRLGLGTEDDHLEPVLVSAPSMSGKSIIAVAAGGHHSAAIVHPGVLYTWGGSSFGKLGHGNESVPACGSPKLVAALSHMRIVQVALGQHNSAALAANGEVYVWGKAQGNRCEDLWTPEKIQDLPPISAITCGKAGIVFTITSSGDVYMRGPMSSSLQAVAAGCVPASDGTGETNRQQIYMLSGKGILQLAAGDMHCIAMADPSRGQAQIGDMFDSLISEASTATVAPVMRPSLYHILESVVRSVPAPPPKPSPDDQIAFFSEELKVYQCQNQKLANRLEEAFSRIAHLERENTTLREELDASTHCLPVGARLSPRETDASTMTVPVVHCEPVVDS